MAAAGFVLLVAGFYVGYRLQISATLADRVRMWQSPWDNTVAGGNQITHAMWAMATGGGFGTGLGLGSSRYLPAGHTDLVLAAVGEELGIAGLVVVAGAFAVLAWRGFRIARVASNDYGFFLATALTLFLALPVLIMASGVVGLTPLTGVVTPFLSYGGSAMLANFAALGILAAIHADTRPAGDFAPFRVPMTWLGTMLAACAVGTVAIAVNVQVVNADAFVVRPHLGIQADGARRFEYNPRILDVASRIPHGTIYDRRGLPLATEMAHVLADARQAYARLGVYACRRLPRCRPSGAIRSAAGPSTSLATHGRAPTGPHRTRRSWSATPADCLRGFDDHAATVRTIDTAGRATYTVTRDYRDLVPLLRHRYDPADPAVVSSQARPRDVRLTLDANLQLRVAAIVADYARKADGRAAAVVLDPDTGAVLASASYPWPTPSDLAPTAGTDAGDALLDRARYGTYPPGSTFKLVVALAALGQNPESGAASTPVQGCRTAALARSFLAGRDRCATMCWTRSRTAPSTCTRGSSIRAMRTSPSSRPGSARRRSWPWLAGLASRSRATRPVLCSAFETHSRRSATGRPRWWPRPCAWPPSRRRLRPMASFTSRTSTRARVPRCGPTDSWTRRRRGASAVSCATWC